MEEKLFHEMKKLGSIKTMKSNDSVIINENVQLEVGKFKFYNEDVYDGEYKINYDEFLLVRQGTGTYITDNFDVYHGEWDDDALASSDVHIKYNNDAQYRGRINSNGAMNGLGTYIFPDGSSVEAIWIDNIPSADIVYRDPFGFSWVIHEMSTNSITFSTGNHFWRNMLSEQSTTHSTDSESPSKVN